MTLCGILLTLSAAQAAAQPESGLNLTTFAGMAMVPGAHAVLGVAVGVKPRDQVPVSLEFEYARTRSDPAGGVPSIASFVGNILIHPSRHPPGLRIYGTIGAGLYVQILNRRSSEANDAWNIGGGIKIALAGPLQLRLDYRSFFLAPVTGEYHSNEHRVYAGITLGY